MQSYRFSLSLTRWLVIFVSISCQQVLNNRRQCLLTRWSIRDPVKVSCFLICYGWTHEVEKCNPTETTSSGESHLWRRIARRRVYSAKSKSLILSSTAYVQKPTVQGETNRHRASLQLLTISAAPEQVITTVQFRWQWDAFQRLLWPSYRH